MTVAMATWLPATPRTAFRVHAFPLAIADPKPQPHSATLEASLESAALSAEGLPSCAATKGAFAPSLQPTLRGRNTVKSSIRNLRQTACSKEGRAAQKGRRRTRQTGGGTLWPHSASGLSQPSKAASDHCHSAATSTERPKFSPGFLSRLGPCHYHNQPGHWKNYPKLKRRPYSQPKATLWDPFHECPEKFEMYLPFVNKHS